MPVYNGERYLVPALDSLLAQTFQDFELIIADNASADSTPEICRQYAARDSRVRYVRNEQNIGVYRNFNKVFGLGTGEYFKFASADDLCDPCLVARCVEVLDADRRVVAAYARTRFIDSDGNPLGWTDPGWHLISDSPFERLKYVLVSGHWVNVPFGVLRSESLRRTRLFPFYPGGDCRLLGELALLGKLVEVPACLFFRRVHAGASSQNSDREWQARFFRGARGRLDLPTWQICLDHAGTILRSGLSTRDKAAGLWIVARRMISGRRELFGELRVATGGRPYRTASRSGGL